MSLKPYYQDKWATVYHGDCREILPLLPKADLLLTDPPYGINAARKRNSQQWGWTDFAVTGWDKERADAATVKQCIEHAEYGIVWGGNYFTDCFPPSSKWLIWDKCQTEFSLADAELAFCTWPGAVRRINYARALALQEGKVHPTQKPVPVMVWCIRQAPKTPLSILDPYLGSGSTLIAAKQLQIKATGIEGQESYCEIAARRLEAETTLFDVAEAKAEQASLL